MRCRRFGAEAIESGMALAGVKFVGRCYPASRCALERADLTPRREVAEDTIWRLPSGFGTRQIVAVHPAQQWIPSLSAVHSGRMSDPPGPTPPTTEHRFQDGPGRHLAGVRNHGGTGGNMPSPPCRWSKPERGSGRRPPDPASRSPGDVAHQAAVVLLTPTGTVDSPAATPARRCTRPYADNPMARLSRLDRSAGQQIPLPRRLP